MQKPAERLSAWEAWHRAMGFMGKRDISGRRALLQQAVALTPRFASAHAMLAFHYTAEATSGMGPSHLESARLAKATARIAIDLDPRNSMAHAILAWTLCQLGDMGPAGQSLEWRPISEMVGSGPFRFLAPDFVMGERSAYERFTGYVPRNEGEPSYTSGPKVAHIDRVEWTAIDDASTATAALLRGEVDWLQAVSADQRPLLVHSAGVTTNITEPAGSIGVMRFNHLQPPFDNPAIRRALLGAINQSDVMNALAGADHKLWRDQVGLFPHGTPLANDAGIAVVGGPRDYDRVKRELAQAGYRGERIIVLGTSGTGYIPVLSQVGADTLRRAGMNIDLQLSDYATMARRMLKTDPPDKGGWNVYFSISDGAFNQTPVTNDYIRGDGKSGAAGWLRSPRFEALRQAWLDAGTMEEQKLIAVDAQRQLWDDVPYIPMGQWLRVTAYRSDLADVPHGFAAFYGVRRPQ